MSSKYSVVLGPFVVSAPQDPPAHEASDGAPALVASATKERELTDPKERGENTLIPEPKPKAEKIPVDL